MKVKTKELELSEKIERRLEMIQAHTKLEKGIFGLFDSETSRSLA